MTSMMYQAANSAIQRAQARETGETGQQPGYQQRPVYAFDLKGSMMAGAAAVSSPSSLNIPLDVIDRLAMLGVGVGKTEPRANGAQLEAPTKGGDTTGTTAQIQPAVVGVNGGGGATSANQAGRMQYGYGDFDAATDEDTEEEEEEEEGEEEEEEEQQQQQQQLALIHITEPTRQRLR
jgi:hypothetical protein